MVMGGAGGGHRLEGEEGEEEGGYEKGGMTK